MTSPTVKVCLVDMNNGLPNQAMRCLRQILAEFEARIHAVNPAVNLHITHVQPRNLGEIPPRDVDLVVSSGGPGSPFDGFEAPWCVGFRSLLDHIITAQQDGRPAPVLLAICHSFELAVMHLRVATVQPRNRVKFGVMPAYMTEQGMRSPLLKWFGDRLFAFEHRHFEVVDVDERQLRALGGEVWARESRDGVSKGRGIMAAQLAPGMEATQFHPEADGEGVLAWAQKPEMATAFTEAYGAATYQQMMDTLHDPTRVARTYALLIPGWLDRQFNQLATARGWNTLAARFP